MARPQLNLLPDIKLTYIKQQRKRNLLVSVAVVVSIICAAIFVMVFITVYGIQKKQLNNSNNSIATSTQQLQQIPGFNDILTAQAQLTQLSTLHKSKHINSRLFSYLVQLTPAGVFINHISVDHIQNAMTLDGTANNAHAVNSFIDTLKFTTYKYPDSTSALAFTSVVENSFGLSPTGAVYSITTKFDPLLFANSKTDANGKPTDPTLEVPKNRPANTTANVFSGGNSPSGGSGQ